MKIYVFIDESGTLPDVKDEFIVLAAVSTINPHILNRFFGKSKREIKFYSAGDKTREQYLVALSDEKVSIFTLCVRKNGQKIPDSPENYAVLSWILLLDCFTYFSNEEIEVIFDRHFSRSVDEIAFLHALKKFFGSKTAITMANSTKSSGVMAADMVAGAYLYSKSGKNGQFFELIQDRVVSEKIINWKEAKKNYIEAIKNSPEPV